MISYEEEQEHAPENNCPWCSGSGQYCIRWDHSGQVYIPCPYCFASGSRWKIQNPRVFDRHRITKEMTT